MKYLTEKTFLYLKCSHIMYKNSSTYQSIFFLLPIYISAFSFNHLIYLGMNLARPSQEGSQDSTPGNYNYNIQAQAPADGGSAFNSNFPRPLTVGRSASSGSSTGAPGKQ